MATFFFFPKEDSGNYWLVSLASMSGQNVQQIYLEDMLEHMEGREAEIANMASPNVNHWLT